MRDCLELYGPFCQELFAQPAFIFVGNMMMLLELFFAPDAIMLGATASRSRAPALRSRPGPAEDGNPEAAASVRSRAGHETGV